VAIALVRMLYGGTVVLSLRLIQPLVVLSSGLSSMSVRDSHVEALSRMHSLDTPE
jgi:hypothetical protein